MFLRLPGLSSDVTTLMPRATSAPTMVVKYASCDALSEVSGKVVTGFVKQI